MSEGIGKHRSLETAEKNTIANVGEKEILKRGRICCTNDYEKWHKKWLLLGKNILVFSPVMLVFFLQIWGSWWFNNKIQSYLWSLIFVYLYYEPCISLLCSSNKLLQTGCLKTAHIYGLPVLQPEVGNQGVSRVVLSPEALERICLHLPPPAPGDCWHPGLCLHHSHLCLHGPLPSFLGVCQMSPSSRELCDGI